MTGGEAFTGAQLCLRGGPGRAMLPRRDRSSWEPVDLTPILEGDADPEPPPKMLARSDGEFLLYAARSTYSRRAGRRQGLAAIIAPRNGSRPASTSSTSTSRTRPASRRRRGGVGRERRAISRAIPRSARTSPSTRRAGCVDDVLDTSPADARGNRRTRRTGSPPRRRPPGQHRGRELDARPPPKPPPPGHRDRPE